MSCPYILSGVYFVILVVQLLNETLENDRLNRGVFERWRRLQLPFRLPFTLQSDLIKSALIFTLIYRRLLQEASRLLICSANHSLGTLMKKLDTQ